MNFFREKYFAEGIDFSGREYLEENNNCFSFAAFHLIFPKYKHLMTTPIIDAVKTDLSRLQNSEYFDVCKTDIIEPLTSLMQSTPALVPIFQMITTVFVRIDDLYKKSLASAHTDTLILLHLYRRALFQLFKQFVRTAERSLDSQDKAAAATLRPLIALYKKIPSSTYVQSSGLLYNFTNDCLKPVYQQAITALGMDFIVTKLTSSNDEFRHIAHDRDMESELILINGKLSEAREEMDQAIGLLISSINSIYMLNEIGAKDAALKSNMDQVILVVNAAIRRIKQILADRRRNRSETGKSPKPPKQKPDISIPAAPDTPPQTPGNNTPPTIDPDELNPPAVGER